MTKEDLTQCNAKWKELHQIEKLLTEIQADARSTRAVCYDSEPKHKGEPIPAVQTYVERLEELSNWYEQLKGSLMKDIRQVEQTAAGFTGIDAVSVCTREKMGMD